MYVSKSLYVHGGEGQGTKWGKGGWGKSYLLGIEVQFCKMKRVLQDEKGSGDCTII